MATAEILVIVYGSCARDPDNDDRFGSEQRRVEITLNPVLPTNVKTLEQKHIWLQDFLRKIHPDIKHNRNWRCEFCKIRARETVWMNASWMRLTPPRATSYVHNVCDAGAGPCAAQVQEVSAEMARLSGVPPSPPPPPNPNPEEKFPLSSSCAVCHDESEKSRKSLKQCARCELTRYCSVDCQRTDWNRHKVCCKAVKEVKWHWI